MGHCGEKPALLCGEKPAHTYYAYYLCMQVGTISMYLYVTSHFAFFSQVVSNFACGPHLFNIAVINQAGAMAGRFRSASASHSRPRPVQGERQPATMLPANVLGGTTAKGNYVLAEKTQVSM